MRLLVEELILKSGYKKRFIADKLGVNENMIRNWENNRSWPRLDQAVKLAEILRCNIEDLYDK